MARVTYTGFSDGDPRDATVINAAWSAYQTQSTNIGAENVRDEGLTARSLGANAATDGYDAARYGASTGGWANFANNAYATLVFPAGPTTMTINNGGAGWAIGSGNGTVRVRASCAFYFDFGVAPPALAVNSNIFFQLRYVTNLGTFDPTETEYAFVHQSQVANVDPFGANTPAYIQYYYGYYTVTYQIPYAVGQTSLTSVSMRAYIVTAGQSFWAEEATLQAVRFVRTF